jgi:hypothetical protein
LTDSFFRSHPHLVCKYTVTAQARRLNFPFMVNRGRGIYMNLVDGAQN